MERSNREGGTQIGSNAGEVAHRGIQLRGGGTPRDPIQEAGGSYVDVVNLFMHIC